MVSRLRAAVSASIKPAPGSMLDRIHRVGRLLARAGIGFLRDQGLHRASALAFDTVLGLVPFLAFLVSALKGFGAYRSLMSETIRPGIISTMLAMGAEKDHEAVGLLSVFLKVLDIVERSSFATLGVLGLILLLYIVVLLLVSVEETMNHIFGVERSRTVTRRITDYSAILFITPIGATLAASVASGSERISWLHGGPFSQFSAALLMAATLTVIYWVMPCRRVRLGSAALGGLVAGFIWYVVLVGHVRFQVGVARYSALYSTFAAIPLFLVWIFASWIVVLYGAELAAAHDKPELFAFRTRGACIDHATRVGVVLRAFAAMAQRSLLGERPMPLGALAEQITVPAELLRRELQRFVEHELLVRSMFHHEPTFVLTRDVDTITVGELLEVLEGRLGDGSQDSGPEPAFWSQIHARILQRSPSANGTTLRQLASWLDEGKPAELCLPTEPQATALDSSR